jgi:hypothetical protein
MRGKVKSFRMKYSFLYSDIQKKSKWPKTFYFSLVENIHEKEWILSKKPRTSDLGNHDFSTPRTSEKSADSDSDVRKALD